MDLPAALHSIISQEELHTLGMEYFVLTGWVLRPFNKDEFSSVEEYVSFIRERVRKAWENSRSNPAYVKQLQRRLEKQESMMEKGYQKRVEQLLRDNSTTPRMREFAEEARLMGFTWEQVLFELSKGEEPRVPRFNNEILFVRFVNKEKTEKDERDPG